MSVSPKHPKKLTKKIVKKKSLPKRLVRKNTSENSRQKKKNQENLISQHFRPLQISNNY